MQIMHFIPDKILKFLTYYTPFYHKSLQSYLISKTVHFFGPPSRCPLRLPIIARRNAVHLVTLPWLTDRIYHSSPIALNALLHLLWSLTAANGATTVGYSPVAS